MALHGKAKGSGGDFEPCPAGPQQLVCCDVVDMGIVDVSWQGQIKRQHKIQIRWQSAEHQAKDGKPALLIQRYTLSMHEKANLRKTLEAWRGKPFASDDDAEAFDIEAVIGANAYGNVMHKQGEKGGTFANLASIMPLPKGMAKVAVVGYERVCERDGYQPPTQAERPQDDDFDARQPGDEAAPNVDDIGF